MTQALPAPGSTARTRVRRLPERAVADRDALHAILDTALVAHVAVTDEGQPYALPVAFARDGDRVLLHGSTGSRLFRLLAAGVPACLTVTVLDGLVLARSAFESSMNYRCAMVLGSAAVLDGEEKQRALRRLTDHLLPGRWDDIRAPSSKELAATAVLAIALDECSVKVRDGGPEDDPQDVGRPVWGGVVPVRQVLGTPEPDPDALGTPVPPYVAGWGRDAG